jgi:hypothetical protein
MLSLLDSDGRRTVVDQTTVIVTAISVGGTLLLVLGVVIALRTRVTKVERRGRKVTVEAVAPMTREFEAKRADVSNHSSIEPLKGTTMKVDKARVRDNSTIRVRDSGEPFADGSSGT